MYGGYSVDFFAHTNQTQPASRWKSSQQLAPRRVPSLSHRLAEIILRRSLLPLPEVLRNYPSASLVPGDVSLCQCVNISLPSGVPVPLSPAHSAYVICQLWFGFSEMHTPPEAAAPSASPSRRAATTWPALAMFESGGKNKTGEQRRQRGPQASFQSSWWAVLRFESQPLKLQSQCGQRAPGVIRHRGTEGGEGWEVSTPFVWKRGPDRVWTSGRICLEKKSDWWGKK